MLNFHAGIIASKHKIGTTSFYTRFGEFIKLFKESDYDESYLDDGGTTGVTCAYWSFLRCAKDEVRDVEKRVDYRIKIMIVELANLCK
ncbi:hypothetical protein BDD12DRAFT_811560 [Trichophaea hybrida]|nr:hypothetical protein BDD12DRAFT_811560 [Trichophaea hybrida]